MNRLFVVAVSALLFAAPAAAQQQPAPAAGARSQFGLGVAIFPSDLLTGGNGVQLYVPIALSPTFRIEPSVALLTSDETGGADRSDFTLGVGVFAVRNVAAPVDMYYGGRLKVNFASVDFGTTDESGTDLSLAAALGGEYYFVPRFSMGLEGQLGFYSNGDASGDNSGLFTNGLAFLRLYL